MLSDLDVLSGWTTDGCMAPIAASLGYSLHLRAPRAVALAAGRFLFSTIVENADRRSSQARQILA